LLGLGWRIRPAKQLQEIGAKGFNTEAHSVHSHTPQVFEEPLRGIGGMNFNANVGPWGEERARLVDALSDQVGRDTGRSAAEIKCPRRRRISLGEIRFDFAIK
jgi:hypothetical protein